MKRLRAAFRRRMNAWIARRNPPVSALTLQQNRIFIFPSSVGMGFGALLLGLLLLAINYQNNLIFMLVFALFSVSIITILHTYINLSGLRIQAGNSEPVFAGETAHFHLHLDSGSRPRYQLQLSFAEQRTVICEMPRAGQHYELRMPYPATSRGRLQPGRLQLRSDFPLGILRCWAMPMMDWHCLVYPRPKMLRPLQSSADSGEGVSAARRDSDEFSGFERYRRGESPRRIFWKAYARGQGLFSKQYEAGSSDRLILDWDSLEGLGEEDRLSNLCAWVLECEQRGLAYGLRVPGMFMPPDLGPAHLKAALRVLALWGGRA
ncbi:MULTISPECIES: DUF58 domain-containing protein [Spongiibacter]|uniref:DUF58 domain-containing protein n=1 Tax=Spongiibacter TaxID=630749 RepID=UPI002352A8F8|nr:MULTISPECIES: DUF58 domain-containing protein [Spongiibacter]